MEKIIINAFGKDKPGLVYKISKIILSQNGNIENSKIYTNDNKNCSSISFDNDTGDIIKPIFIPFQLTSQPIN